MGNPSDHVDTPLTGGYLLIVLAEPRSAEHKLAILKRLTKGLSCWNFEESSVEIATELNAIVNQNIEGEEGKNGEQLFQYASDHLVAEILINPQHSTLVQCVRNLLASFTKYRCIIHAGYSFTENGSWILQDGSFSVADFLDAYKTAEAQRTVRLHENQIRTELHCSGDGDWIQASRVKDTRFVLNPQEKIIDNKSIESTVRWLCDKIEVVELDTLLEGSQVVGNIRFSRPTLYVFPAGQGDSALFGINGFNMLIDGGTGRNSCFWGFARHLDRLDAVLLTRLNSTNLEGVASFLKRKTMSSLYPQIGHFFCNFKTRKQVSSPSVDVKKDVLSISIIDTAQSIISDLKQLQLRPHLCYRNINLEPINLYHKVGHGKLDMYVLNPSKDSKDVKDFLSKWNEGDQKLFNASKDLQFPLPNIISICTLLVWQPANPNNTITRIFFPGSSPQNKIFEALERVRHLEFLKHPSCSIKSMNSSTSVTIKSQTTKKTVLEKMIPGETKTVKTVENLEVSTTGSNAVIQTAIIPTVPKEGTPKPKSPTDSEKPKTNNKTVIKETSVKSKTDNKYSLITAKVNSNKIVQKNTTMKKPLKLSSKSPPTDKSSPTTPSENPEKTAKPTKQIIKPKATPSSVKSPTSTPTKSKKEEANRKVLVTSRTNSGLRRTQTTKKETNQLNIKINELKKPAIKKDSNIVYKSSLISGNKDKSGEEEDILIIEKVAITPEKLLTPDGKKIIANELDGILTAAKDIVTKEKCPEKLSESGATTAPTMPEDEKATESKKEIEINEAAEKRVEEFRKTKEALKTPDEVADLPFHEEVDEQESKVEETKQNDTVIETQEIVQVEKAEYVLVSLDSSPEVLKRQVLDTVDLLDTEPDSDKEDEIEEHKENNLNADADEKSKLIEHLLESSKDLYEITEKIDELKKQNEENIKLENETIGRSNHEYTESSNVKNSKQIIDLETESNVQEGYKSNEEKYESDNDIKFKDTNENTTSYKVDSLSEDPTKYSETETITKSCTERSRSNSFCREQVDTHLNFTDRHESKSLFKEGSVSKEPIKYSEMEKTIDDNGTISGMGSVSQEQINEQLDHPIVADKIESKASSKIGSICEEQVLESDIEISTKEITTSDVDVKQESKTLSKAGSICDEQLKDSETKTIAKDCTVSSRSSSVSHEQENAHPIITDKNESRSLSKTGSVSEEHVKDFEIEHITKEITVSNVADKLESKKLSKTGSINEIPSKDSEIKKITQASRSSSVCQNQEVIRGDEEETQLSKALSSENSMCEEEINNFETETITKLKEKSNISSFESQKQESTHHILDDKNESKVSSITESLCEELNKDCLYESIIQENRSNSFYQEKETVHSVDGNKNESKPSNKAGPICEEEVKDTTVEQTTREITISDIANKDENKTSSKAGSVCDEQLRDSETKTITKDCTVSSRSSSVGQEQENEQLGAMDQLESKTSSKAGSICEEQIKDSEIEMNSKHHEKTSRSSSICQEQGNAHPISTDKNNFTSSKTGSICEDSIKDFGTEKIIKSSRSSSVCQEQENAHFIVTDKNESQVSSKAESMNEEPINDSETEKTTKASRLSSIFHEQETVHSAVKDTQSSKTLSKEESISEDPIKDSKIEHVTKEITISDVADKVECETSSKAGSIIEETIKDSETEKNTKASESNSVILEQETIQTAVADTQSSKASSKEESISEDPIKDSKIEHTTKEIIILDVAEKQESSSNVKTACEEQIKDFENITKDCAKSIRSSSICQEQKTPDLFEADIYESKTTRKAESVFEKQIKGTANEPITEYRENTCRSSSISHEQGNEQINTVDKHELNAGSVCDESIKNLESETIIKECSKTSRSGSVFQVQENNMTDIDVHDSESSSRKNSLCFDKTKSSIISSSRTSSICQELDTRSSKLSSTKSSIVEELTDKSSKLQNDEKSFCSQESNISDCKLKSDQESRIVKEADSFCDGILNLSSNNVTEYNTDSKLQEQDSDRISNIEKSESIPVCEIPMKSPDLEINSNINILSNKLSPIGSNQEKLSVSEIENQNSTLSNNEVSTCDEPIHSSVFESNEVCQDIEKQKSQPNSRKSSTSGESRKLSSHGNDVILSSSSQNDNSLSNVKETRIEELKSLGTIGSLHEEIAKFLTEDDKKTSKILKSEQSNKNQSESAVFKSNTEESKVILETVMKNSNTSISDENKCILTNMCDSNKNDVNESLKHSDKVKTDDCYDNNIHKSKEDSLPIPNISGTNITTSNISTLSIEENNKTGKINVAQMVEKNVDNESLTKHTVITTNEYDGLKTINSVLNTTSDECISKSSTVLIEDVVKTYNEKNTKCDDDDNNSTVTGMSIKQSLGVTLNSEDLGLTKDIVMQLKRDVHEVLHQFSSDDDRPFTPHSESSMSRSAMNIDDEDYDDTKNETDDDIPGSPMSTGPSPLPMQLDNRNIEMDLDFNKALQEHRLTRGEDLTTIETNGNHVTEIKTTEHDNINQNQGTSSDTVQSWGKPLGLPPIQNLNNNGFDPIRDWGKPLGLPSPTQPVHEISEPQNMSSKTTPKKHVKKTIDNKPIINVIDKDAQNRIRRSESPSKLRSRSSSRMSRVNPIYLDLIYVPHHGNSKYVSADFFKRIRARNYVFSGTDPSKEVLNALLEGKQTWEDKDLEVTIIPTYDTDMLGQWVSENEELLAKLKIDLSPSASRCTIKLQDHNTSCSAYRLEF